MIPPWSLNKLWWTFFSFFQLIDQLRNESADMWLKSVLKMITNINLTID